MRESTQSLRRPMVWWLLAALCATMMVITPFAGRALAAEPTHVKVGSLTGHACFATEWHFVISGLANTADAPATIRVWWLNGFWADVPQDPDSPHGSTADYTTTLYLDSEVVDATAVITGPFSNFVLSHGPCHQLAADLDSFEATAGASGVLLQWQTASEVRNLGFNIYRARTASGPWTLLNAALVPSKSLGSSAGQSYERQDGRAWPGLSYYRLEAVDLSGSKQVLGTTTMEFAQKGPIWRIGRAAR